MNKALILSTNWKDNYWVTDGYSTAIYPGSRYDYMSDWDTIEEEAPIQGIGLYKTRISNENFLYLKIRELKTTPNNEPRFVFKSIDEAEVKSEKLEEYLPGKYYYTVSKDELMDTLDELDENPPEEWMSID